MPPVPPRIAAQVDRDRRNPQRHDAGTRHRRPTTTNSSQARQGRNRTGDKQ